MNEPYSPLIAVREAAGLSQSAAARRSGVPRNTVHKLESGGRCIVKLSQLRALGTVLNAEPRGLIGPGQAVQCDNLEELDEFAGDRGWRLACESGQDEARSVVAQWLGLEPADERARAYIDSLRNVEAASA